jgi:TetR/AcrR family transcriptional regulator, cholesterol catabolism regulator
MATAAPVPDPLGGENGENGDPGALARSQAARRRRMLDATLKLAAAGGFDAVQMRDVAAEANVALGTIYRYFASKERMLLEAMVEQLDDLRAWLHMHPLPEATAGARVVAVLGRSNANLRRYPDVTAAMVRSFGASSPDNADVVVRVSATMTDIIITAIGHDSERDRRVARTIVQVWLASLIGWVGGVDPPERVDDDIRAVAALLLPA